MDQWIFSQPGTLFESYCYKASGDKVFGGSAKHLWSMFYNKSHVGGPDALAQGPGFQSVLASQFLSQPLFFHKWLCGAALLCLSRVLRRALEDKEESGKKLQRPQDETQPPQWQKQGVWNRLIATLDGILCRRGYGGTGAGPLAMGHPLPSGPCVLGYSHKQELYAAWRIQKRVQERLARLWYYKIDKITRELSLESAPFKLPLVWPMPFRSPWVDKMVAQCLAHHNASINVWMNEWMNQYSNQAKTSKTSLDTQHSSLIRSLMFSSLFLFG